MFEYLDNFFFKDWKILNNDAPKDFLIQTVVTMYDKISSVYNFSRRGNLYFRINFQDSVHGFSNNLEISFYKLAIYSIIAEYLKVTTTNIGFFFNFLTSSQYVK